MPDRLALIKGPPAGRRTHLDGFCAALWPTRAESRRRYSRALAQRNALLGRIRAGAASVATLDAWDLGLATAGVELSAIRAEAVDRLAPAVCAGRRRARPWPGSGLRYRPRSDATDAEQLAAELAERRDSDLARGYTGWGPHLDELAVEFGDRALRRFGSQGQQRTALLALLFAERRALLDDGRPPPLMLLDDVTSRARRRAPGAAGRAPSRRRRPGADHCDRARPPAADGARASRSRCATAIRSPRHPAAERAA